MLKPKKSARWFIASVIVFVTLTAFSDLLRAKVATESVKAAVQAMEQASGAPVKTVYSKVTGLATFVDTEIGQPIPLPCLNGCSPEEISLAFFTFYGAAFGIAESSQLRLTRLKGPDVIGMHHVRFLQLHEGVPIRWAELTVHLRGSNVVRADGKTLAKVELTDMAPTLTPAKALRAVEEFLEAELGITDATLSTPRLEIFNLGLLTGIHTPTKLAWFIEATKHDQPFHEYLWFDAHLGAILHHSSQVTRIIEKPNRIVHNEDVYNDPIRNEGDPATGDLEVDLAYDYSGDFYDYFLNQHDRKSYDNQEAPLISVVRYADTSFCSKSSAVWKGKNANFCEGVVVDDVVGHEFNHGLLRSEGVGYDGETKGLNEAYCSIFGEIIDLTNGRGTDTPEMRWKLAEDIRVQVPLGWTPEDMMNPNEKGFPGKVSDPQLRCYDHYDNRTIAMHAFALMTDGGSYNGFTINRIGIEKAAKIHYLVMTHHLNESTNFFWNYQHLQSVCKDLANVNFLGITTTDCVEVKKALDAVEMSHPLACPEYLLTANDQHTINVHFSRGDGTFSPPISVGEDLGVNYTEFAIINDSTFVASTDESPPKLFAFKRLGRSLFTQTFVKTLDADPNPIHDYGLGLTGGHFTSGGREGFLENINIGWTFKDGSTWYWIGKGNLCLTDDDDIKEWCIGFYQTRDSYDFSNIFTGWTLGKSSNLADVDGDGYSDMLASEQENGGIVSSKVYLLRGKFGPREPPDTTIGHGFYFQSPVHVFTTANHPATHMTLGDFNNDGKVDAIVGQDDDGDPGAAFLFLGRGDGTFAQKGIEAFDTRLDIEGGTDQRGGGMFKAYDADHDGILDIISAVRLYGLGDNNPETAKLLIFPGLGDGTFEDPVIIYPFLLTATAFTAPSTFPEDVYVKSAEIVNNKFPRYGRDDVMTNHDRAPCAPAAHAGTYTITATFKNTSQDTLSNLIFQVATLDGGNVLCNADDGPGGIGAELTVPWHGELADGLLAPQDSFVVQFQIGLASMNPFKFYVNLSGIVQ